MALFIISEILGGIAICIGIISSFIDNKRYYFALMLVSYIFYAASFLTNQNYVAGINTSVSIIRGIILYIYAKRGNKTPYWVLSFSAIYITIGIIFMDDLYDIIPMITPILFTLSFLMKNMLLLRYWSLPPNMMLVAYGILKGAYTNAIVDVLDCVVLTIAIIRMHIMINKKKNQDTSIDYEKIVREDYYLRLK